MSVINVKPSSELQPLSESLDEYGFPVSEFELSWTVLFDDADPLNSRPLLASSAESIPELYSLLSGNEWMYAYAKRVVQISLHLYEVLVSYRSIGNPLARPPIIETDATESQEPVDRDVYGYAIANSAGQSFDPPLQETFSDAVLRIRVNRATYNPITDVLYRNSVNSDSFWGFDPGKALCQSIRGVPMRAGPLWYFEHAYEFRFRDDEAIGPEGPANWKRRVKNEGLMCFDTAEDKELIRCVDKNGEPVTEPVPLAADGTQLAAAEEPNWLLFETKTARPFSALGLADVYAYWLGL